jgi:hypothetical protein
MPALRYERLDGSRKTIRLLTVLPGDEHESIRCELTHADLDDRLPYIALSYTWDHAGGYDELECNGVVIQASKNLWNRVWINQEFLVPEHVEIWCGGYHTEAERLRKMVWTVSIVDMRHNSRYASLWESPGRILLQYREEYRLLSIREEYGRQLGLAGTPTDTSAPSFRLWPLLLSFSASKCSLPNDKVYALLGIATDATNSPHPIIPDYNKSVVELFVDVLRNQCGEDSVKIGMRKDSSTAFVACLT